MAYHDVKNAVQECNVEISCICRWGYSWGLTHTLQHAWHSTLW